MTKTKLVGYLEGLRVPPVSPLHVHQILTQSGVDTDKAEEYEIFLYAYNWDEYARDHKTICYYTESEQLAHAFGEFITVAAEQLLATLKKEVIDVTHTEWNSLLEKVFKNHIFFTSNINKLNRLQLPDQFQQPDDKPEHEGWFDFKKEYGYEPEESVFLLDCSVEELQAITQKIKTDSNLEKLLSEKESI